MKVIRFLFLLFVAVVLFPGCEQVDPSEPEPVTPTEPGFTLSVSAYKEGTLINKAWAAGDSVSVFNETREMALNGSLTAQGSGTTTTLKGKLTGTVSAGDQLTLMFLRNDYSTQDGTLTGNPTSIDKTCDCATATVTVASVNENAITLTGRAEFEPQQAIVKFTLVNSSDDFTRIETNYLQVVAGETEVRVTPSSVQSEIYVAVPAMNDRFVRLIAETSLGRKYDFAYISPRVSFERGQFYEMRASMVHFIEITNETKLNDALADFPYIQLGYDITLESCLKIAGSVPRNLTLDLNGHLLQRSGLTAPTEDGHVIEVMPGGSLTLTDGSSTGNGTVRGGWAGKGGGICNSGTFTLNSGTVRECQAGQGGGIWNNGTLTLNSSEIVANKSDGLNSGGGIYQNGGTLYLSGKVVVKDNISVTNGSERAENILLPDDQLITVNGAFREGASIGLYRTSGVVSTNYSTFNSGVDPGKFFFADAPGVTLQLKYGEIFVAPVTP